MYDRSVSGYGYQLMTSYFGAESDKDNVWDFIDPASRVARPLDLESTASKDEGEKQDNVADAVKATTSSAPTPPLQSR